MTGYIFLNKQSLGNVALVGSFNILNATKSKENNKKSYQLR